MSDYWKIINKKFQRIVRHAISRNYVPGCLISVRTGDEEVPWSFGSISYDPELNIKPSTAINYDVGSISKKLCALAVWKLISLHEITTDTLVTHRNLLSFRHPSAKFLTVGDLLSYGVWFKIKERLQKYERCMVEGLTHREWCREFFETTEVVWLEKPDYTNLPPFVLGLFLEKLLGKGLDEILYELVFEPLQMFNTVFDLRERLSDFDRKRFIAPTSKNIRLGEPHDPFARFHFPHPISVSGLFSNLWDMGILRDVLMGELGKDDKERYLSQDIHKQILEKGLKLALSYQPKSPIFVENAVFTTSYTGCMVMSAPVSEIGPVGLVVLSNPVSSSTHKLRIKNQPPIYWLRRGLVHAVLSSVTASRNR